jgi:tRNA(Ile2)-agmatinylcytidine synthase
MPLYIAFDDTDSPWGMCTTYVLTELIKELNFPVLSGFPRLVRLNPNIPWKTRGNGALCLAIGGDEAKARTIGSIGGREVRASWEPGNSPRPEEVFETACAVIESMAQFQEENTNPALVVSDTLFDEEFYWKCVRDIASVEEALNHLRRKGVLYRTWKNGRGIIGATASLCWPARKRTFELIAYRYRERWGKPRHVSAHSVSLLSTHFPSTFSNYDYVNRHICITPSSPCPVLLGIRGTNPWELEPAFQSIECEDAERWLIFETNQATDDHIERDPQEIRPFHSYLLSGTVASPTITIEGGHCFFSLSTDVGKIECSAFEETKGLRAVIRQLIPGDRVSVWGAYKPWKKGYSLNIEKIAVEHLHPLRVKLSNPLCPVCGKRMDSIGKEKGYRCKRCHTKSSEAIYQEVPRGIKAGVYGVAVSSRRHLSTPPEKMADLLSYPLSGKHY